MKNETNDGIFCDYCGDEVKGDFTYYSFDFHSVKIARQISRQSDEAIMSADLCERCMELFRQRLLKVAEKIQQSPTRCDVTGKNFGNSDQTYYRCRIASVKVNASNQQYACEKCGKPRDPQEGPCECDPEARQLVREAKVEFDDKHLDLNFCAEIYAKFRQHIEYVKGSGEAEWT